MKEEYIVLYYDADNVLKEDYRVSTVAEILEEYQDASIEVVDIVLNNE